jgi:hypothetical protein
MAARKPLVIVSGFFSELPASDTTVVLAVAPSGLIYVGSTLGIDGSAQISGNAGISAAVTAQASGNAGISAAVTAQISGNAGISAAVTAQASGNAALVVGTTALASGNAALASGNAALVNTSTLFARNLVAGSGLLGGGNLSADRRFDADISSQAVAQSGTDNTTLMTPLRVAQAIAVQGSSYTYTTTSVDKVLSNKERCMAASGFLTLTLPSPPASGNEVSVIVPSNSPNVVLSGAGYVIMGLNQNLTVDSVSKTVTLVYANTTNGWSIF